MKADGFSDLHQHVLWGIDDGPRTPEQMQALLRQDMEEGIRLVYATSHAYPQERAFNYALYRERLREANAYCKSQGWPLHVLPGCEIHYCPAVADHLAAGKLPPSEIPAVLSLSLTPTCLPPRSERRQINYIAAGIRRCLRMWSVTEACYSFRSAQ